jgi:CubicO group peptidase (beta-lactamase class C family)
VIGVGVAVVALALASASPWSPATAPAFPEGARAALDDVIAEARSVGESAGLSVGVLYGERVYRAARGFGEHAPFRSATVSSRYRAASITKTFTAIVAMRLAAAGILDLDADVRRYVPAYRANAPLITVRQLLAHTSGLPHYRSVDDAMTRVPHTTSQSLAIFADRPLVGAPGAGFWYSSFGYNLAGAALEGATGKSFGALLEEQLFAPLGMTRSGLEGGARPPDDVAGYRIDGARLVRSSRLDISSRFASGGTRTTVDDLLRFARALHGGALVDASTWRTMTTPTITPDGRQADYGLGFALYPLRGRNVVAHAGGQPEASSLLLLVPEERLSIVLLTNLEGQGALLSALAASIIDVVLDDGARRRELYSADVVDEVVFDGMTRIFTHGLAAHARNEAHSDADVASAFAALPGLFSRARIASAPVASRQALRDAYHPYAGRVSVRVGREMARVLALGSSAAVGPAAPRARPPRDAAAFFSAYVDACGHDCAHPLPGELVADAVRFRDAWRTTPAPLLALRREHVADHLLALRVLQDRPLHPSFVDDLLHVALRARGAGRIADAQAALELSAELHPRSPLAHIALAEADVLAGDMDRAARRLHGAWALPARPLVIERDALRQRRLPSQGATDAWRSLVDALAESTAP